MRVDLNADVGESVERWHDGSDRRVLEHLTSANVCCGAYAGTPELIAATCAAAADLGIVIGAQVGYHDPEGFGRRKVDIAPGQLSAQIADQIQLLRTLAGQASVRYVKPHGALYNRIVHDDEHARAVVDALGDLPLLGLPGSRSLSLAAEYGVEVYREGFADRRYTSDGTLVPRSEPGAVLADADAAADQALRLMGSADQQDNHQVDSICVHSDSPAAAQMIRRVRIALEGAGVRVEPFR